MKLILKLEKKGTGIRWSACQSSVVQETEFWNVSRPTNWEKNLEVETTIDLGSTGR